MLGVIRLCYYLTRRYTHVSTIIINSRGTDFFKSTKAFFLLLFLVNSFYNTDELLHCTLCIRPVTNSAKPLLSRLLLENSNNSKDQATKRKAEEPLPDWNVDQSLLDVVTPKKLEDVKDQVYQISQLGKASAPTARVLFRKVSKA